MCPVRSAPKLKVARYDANVQINIGSESGILKAAFPERRFGARLTMRGRQPDDEEMVPCAEVRGTALGPPDNEDQVRTVDYRGQRFACAKQHHSRRGP